MSSEVTASSAFVPEKMLVRKRHRLAISLPRFKEMIASCSRELRASPAPTCVTAHPPLSRAACSRFGNVRFASLCRNAVAASPSYSHQPWSSLPSLAVAALSRRLCEEGGQLYATEIVPAFKREPARSQVQAHAGMGRAGDNLDA